MHSEIYVRPRVHIQDCFAQLHLQMCEFIKQSLKFNLTRALLTYYVANHLSMYDRRQSQKKKPQLHFYGNKTAHAQNQT